MSSKYIKPPKTPKAKATPDEHAGLPEDLKNLWGSVQAASTAFTTIQKGHYTHEWHTNVKNSLMWLAEIHAQCMQKVMDHPQADLLSEVREMKKQEQEAKDGKTQENTVN